MWHGDYPLKEAFPKFYSIIRAREALVAKIMCFSNGRPYWDVQFSRPVHDWELESLASFMDMIYSREVRDNGSDKICWKPAKFRGFEVRGYYHSLSTSSVKSFSRKMVWQAKVPLRLAFFSWSAALGKILSIDNPRKRT